MKTTAIKAWIALIALMASGYGVVVAQTLDCSCERNTAVAFACTESLRAPDGTTLPNERLSDVRISYPELYSGIGSQGARPLPQNRNPVLFFEERANWPALGIAQPRTAWEYAQRGIYRQDERENDPGSLEAAVADYLKAEEESNGRILIVESRLAYISLQEGERRAENNDETGAMQCFDEAIERFCRVLEEAPFHQGVHFERGEALKDKFDITTDQMTRQSLFNQARQSFQCELELAPNSQRTHFALAELYMEEGCTDVFGPNPGPCQQGAITSLDVYLRQARWHSDTQPIRLLKAQMYCQDLGGARPPNRPGCQ